MPDLNRNRRLVLSTIAIVWVIGLLVIVFIADRSAQYDRHSIGVAVSTNVVLPPNDSAFRLLKQMARDFNEAKHETESGTIIEVEVRFDDSNE